MTIIRMYVILVRFKNTFKYTIVFYVTVIKSCFFIQLGFAQAFIVNFNVIFLIDVIS